MALFSLTNILTAISLLLTVVGLYLLGEKVAIGFLIFSASVFCQFIIFYKEKKWFLVIQMLILFVFNTMNYFKW